jgi:hypothetical protein
MTICFDPSGEFAFSQAPRFFFATRRGYAARDSNDRSECAFQAADFRLEAVLRTL